MWSGRKTPQISFQQSSIQFKLLLLAQQHCVGQKGMTVTFVVRHALKRFLGRCTQKENSKGLLPFTVGRWLTVWWSGVGGNGIACCSLLKHISLLTLMCSQDIDVVVSLIVASLKRVLIVCLSFCLPASLSIQANCCLTACHSLLANDKILRLMSDFFRCGGYGCVGILCRLIQSTLFSSFQENEVTSCV